MAQHHTGHTDPNQDLNRDARAPEKATTQNHMDRNPPAAGAESMRPDRERTEADINRDAVQHRDQVAREAKREHSGDRTRDMRDANRTEGHRSEHRSRSGSDRTDRDHAGGSRDPSGSRH